MGHRVWVREQRQQPGGRAPSPERGTAGRDAPAVRVARLDVVRVGSGRGFRVFGGLHP